MTVSHIFLPNFHYFNWKKKGKGISEDYSEASCDNMRTYCSLIKINAMIKNVYSRPHVVSLQSSFGFPTKTSISEMHWSALKLDICPVDQAALFIISWGLQGWSAPDCHSEKGFCQRSFFLASDSEIKQKMCLHKSHSK